MLQSKMKRFLLTYWGVQALAIGGVIPEYFNIQTSERTTNESNLKKALQRQFSVNDNINAAMWLIQ